MGFINKFISKFTNKAGERLTDKAIDKIFGNKNNTETNISTQQPQQTNTVQTEQPENNQALDTAQMAMMTAMAKEQTKQMQLAQESMAQFNNLQANANIAGIASMNMAQYNEILNYMIFDDNMEVIGVKENAPDWMKQAYKSGKFNNK